MIWPHTRNRSDHLFYNMHKYANHIERNSPWLHCSRSLGKRSLWRAVSESFRHDINQRKLQCVNRPFSDLYYNCIMTYNSYYSIYNMNVEILLPVFDEGCEWVDTGWDGTHCHLAVNLWVWMSCDCLDYIQHISVPTTHNHTNSCHKNNDQLI